MYDLDLSKLIIMDIRAVHRIASAENEKRTEMRRWSSALGDAIQPFHPLSSPSPPAPNPSQHQALFQ